MPSKLKRILDAISTVTEGTPDGPTVSRLAARAKRTLAAAGGMRSGIRAKTFILEPNARIPGTNYVLTKPMTKAGQSVIWHCTQEFWPDPKRLERAAVAKIFDCSKLPQHHASAVATRARREAKATGHAINNPHVLEFYDSAIICDAQGKIAMIVLIFEDHDCNLLEFAQMLDHRFPLRLLRRLMFQTADGFSYAHSPHIGIIHRDPKPQNMFIASGPAPRPASDGSVSGSHAAGTIDWRGANIKVADFGLAEDMDPAEAEEDITRGLLGTPNYMPPEQVLGITNAKSDVYGLGATWYHAVSGFLPFQEGSASSSMKAMEVVARLKKRTQPKPLAERMSAQYLHPDLISLIDSMMDQDPERRPDMDTVKDLLEDMALPRDRERDPEQTIGFAGKEGAVTLDTPASEIP